MNDIRYSEFLFLQGLASEKIKLFNHREIDVGIRGNRLDEMVATLIEELYVELDEWNLQPLVSRLRGELGPDYLPVHELRQYWEDPRRGLLSLLAGSNTLRKLRITYRGLRRMEELRDLLRRDRILDRFGVLLDMRYFDRDLDEALKRTDKIAVSVIRADMDRFKRINDDFGHEAGDIVMKRYLECVRDGLGLLGTGYRDQGDEIVALVIGQVHERTVQIANDIRERVAAVQCEYQKTKLPAVTASLGVATSPPSQRTAQLETLADDRQLVAKQRGRNCVVSE